MFLCRVAWQRCWPLARKSLTHRVNLNRDVPRRLMSSVPGSSGENWIYVILCGGALTGAAAYGYSTLISDSARFAERISEIQTRPKRELHPKPWSPTGGEEVAETPTEAVGEGAGLVKLAGEVNKREAETVVETVAEAIAEAAEVVVEVATVVEETAEDVEAVAREVEVIAEEVESAAEAFEAPKLLVVETRGVEEPDTTDLEEPTAMSNVAQVNTELSAASVLKEPLVVFVGEVIPVEVIPG
ncbi:protein MGARP isoform X2 [Brachyhypopomus gauderio]|uniref:protein MGARP isoform X2 n=1 Tax=Brachyhypopomus gauderio TaxID=698409 RepID=UPI004040FFC4